jgi:hypothetical protein
MISTGVRKHAAEIWNLASLQNKLISRSDKARRHRRYSAKAKLSEEGISFTIDFVSV